MTVPTTYEEFKTDWSQRTREYWDDYATGRQTFLPALPEDVLAFPIRGVLYALERRYGAGYRQALNPDERVPSPVRDRPDGSWLKTSNLVGINVRTVGNFWRVIPYVMTLPRAVDGVHLLPIWEPGVVASLYGMASWQLNDEFFSPELAEALPHLDTLEKQLRVVVNLLHLMGRTVGLDVIPHTDRYAEIVLTNPTYFEWLQRRGFEIRAHGTLLYEPVQGVIFEWLTQAGPAEAGRPLPARAAEFWGETWTETERGRALFGTPTDRMGRNKRRNGLIQRLYEAGYEPVPATMAPPYRGLIVDPNPQAAILDEDGRLWREYLIEKPEGMSRVFGPLGRYHLYETLPDSWTLDFSRPRTAVWQYVSAQYAEAVRRYDFDFMRGDMSHVQMRPAGVPATPDAYYDIHRYIKAQIRNEKPHFGYFAESFLAPAGRMAYGDEPDHLDASDADVTLGDLQSRTVGTPEFVQALRYYRDLLDTRTFAPAFTVMTADKDDPRFDWYYQSGNEVRAFLAYFLTDMPSYTGLGFELRDPRLEPAPNEYYTKLYVFQLREGRNATRGPYRWGQNAALFGRLTRLKQFADSLWSQIQYQPVRWLLPPDATGHQYLLAWTQATEPRYLFVANLDPKRAVINAKVPAMSKHWSATQVFSTHRESRNERLFFNGKVFQLDELAPGEGRAYALRAEGAGE
jgi:hypothetical protein